MQLAILNEVISDPALLSQGYRFLNGYIFTAIRHPANVFDAILIRNPSSARRFGDGMPESFHTLNEHIDFINQHGIEKALIIADDISFLKKCPTLQHLNIIPSVTAGNSFDFSPLYELSGIKSLRCATSYGKHRENSTGIDYAQIHGLEDLSVRSENEKNYRHIPTLKTLRISEYKGSDLTELFCSKVLDTLELVSCKIRTLDGIDAAPKIQCLYLSYNRQLEDIHKLENTRKSLRALRIQNCPRIRDFSVLGQLDNLEYLFLKGSNKLPSLQFITALPKLKTFILDMEVEDGDLTPCLHLSYVHCDKICKHYNLKAKDLPKGAYYRGNENIELWRRIW